MVTPSTVRHQSPRKGRPKGRGIRVSFRASWRAVLILAGWLLLSAEGVAQSCGVLPVAPDRLNPIDLATGVSNVNAALGTGGLTAGMSACGELTVLKWPGPSYFDQLAYLSSNEPDARQQPRMGALESDGAFPGISYFITGQGWQHTWLRDPGWTHQQHYSHDDSNVLVHEVHNPSLGLRVKAYYFVLPDSDVLVNDYEIVREPGSPVRVANMVFYTNFAPTDSQLPYFPIADWALDFQNDFAILFDRRERALLHFAPKGGRRDFSMLNPLLEQAHSDAASRATLERKVETVIDGLTAQGTYIAIGMHTRGQFSYQAGFDDSLSCAHQSVFANRTLSSYELPPAFEPQARLLFDCAVAIRHPDGPLADCREANGWSYQAESAFTDAQDGKLSGSPMAACQSNGALSVPLRFRPSATHRRPINRGRSTDQRSLERPVEMTARATFYVSVGATRDDAYEQLRVARTRNPVTHRAETDAWWASFLSSAKLPDTDDPLVSKFSKRSLIAIRTATDKASGAIVASITTQPSYGADWPRDGAFINYALDMAGFHEIVTHHNAFYARVQRKKPEGWSFFYNFPTCEPLAPVYPDCIPAGTFEMNYYGDPNAVLPAGFMSFEIDQAGFGVWTLWEHARHLTDPVERAAYLDTVCPSIELGASNLAACRDDATGLQCYASEGDTLELTQGVRGAVSVLIALDSAVAAEGACGFSPEDVTSWSMRIEELRAATLENFFDEGPPARLTDNGGGAGAGPWALWPVAFFDYDDPRALSHAESLHRAITRLLDRSAPSAGYNTESLVSRAQFFRAIGDEAALAQTQDEVRFFMRELSTPGTGHIGEFFVRVQADLNGDGVSPDYLPVSAAPHVWQGAYLYIAAMAAFGSNEPRVAPVQQ